MAIKTPQVLKSKNYTTFKKLGSTFTNPTLLFFLVTPNLLIKCKIKNKINLQF